MSDVKLLCVTWWNVVNIVWGERIEIKFKSSITGPPIHIFHSLKILKCWNTLNFLWSLNRIFPVSILKQENCAIFISKLGEFFRTLLSFTRARAHSFWIKSKSYNFSLWYFIGNLLLNKLHFMLHSIYRSLSQPWRSPFSFNSWWKVLWLFLITLLNLGVAMPFVFYPSLGNGITTSG